MMLMPPDAAVTAAWLAFLTPIMVAGATAVNIIIARYAANAATKNQRQMTQIQELGEKTHTLVNSEHGIALTTVLEQAIRLASLTHTPADVASVTVAQQKVNDHDARQNIVDAAEAKRAEDKPPGN
jgi:hypothetical protein